MKNTHIALLLLALLLVPGAFAVAPSNQVTITSYPSYLRDNQDLALTFTLSDPTNDTQNVTARLYVDGVNVQNSSRTNLITNNTHTNTTTFSNGLYSFGDVVYVNYITTESANASNTNQTNSTSWTVIESSTALIAQDAFDGLSEAGGEVGDFIGNTSGGLFKFLLLMGLAVAIVALIAAIAVMVKGKATSGFGKAK